MNGTVTRSPARQPSTSGPTAAITPASSCPGTCGSADVGVVAHPAVPVAAAQPGRLDPDHDAVLAAAPGRPRLDARRRPEPSKTTARIRAEAISPHDAGGRGASLPAAGRGGSQAVLEPVERSLGEVSTELKATAAPSLGRRGVGEDPVTRRSRATLSRVRTARRRRVAFCGRRVDQEEEGGRCRSRSSTSSPRTSARQTQEALAVQSASHRGRRVAARRAATLHAHPERRLRDRRRRWFHLSCSRPPPRRRTWQRSTQPPCTEVTASLVRPASFTGIGTHQETVRRLRGFSRPVVLTFILSRGFQFNEPA